MEKANMMRNVSRRSVLAVLLFGMASLPPSVAQGEERSRTYIALGDSLAFGVSDVDPVSYGDQGYVKPYADWLATQDNGVRPRVINLAIPGETSDSFFTGMLPPWWQRAILNNLNYTSATQTQMGKFLEVVAAEKAADRRIEVVSFAIGANDLQALVVSPVFNAPGANQRALIDQTLGDIYMNYVRFLTQFRAQLPHARLLLLNYYNPFEVLGPDDPINRNFTYAAGVHSAFVQKLARRYRGHFVDIYRPFLGHAAEYTYILDGNEHPNELGYSVIAQQMIRDDESD
jgi:lysophospholipase L1-like esterase